MASRSRSYRRVSGKAATRIRDGDPAFVGRHQLIGGIQGSQVHFDFVGAAGENRRAAAGTEKPPGVVACFTSDRHRILGEHRGSVKQRPMMLAAVETVAKADPVGRPDATIRTLPHRQPPVNRSMLVSSKTKQSECDPPDSRRINHDISHIAALILRLIPG